VTTTATHPTVACPTWCRRVHNESPLEFILHESAGEEIFSLPHPNGLSRPAIRVSLGQSADDRVYVLVGDHELTPVDAEHLIAVLRSTLDQAYVTLADLAGDAR
jgi:hypothetical protein